ncbi:WD40 repeat-like protein [Moesziomyces antarcticus]|uniref:Polyadenylation factor subunit 2 n=1 Tax=Pseudozyma antarctica TaxID=84753 RepID=A0A5C3FH12_PSEA2|nr:WD40 repeat-like protein [Moesziomyces antarcticus]GAK62452.1 WD40 repeat-like protein [Moesziomyces antarcticus]SPO43007.1 related to PFS2 - polyadenylation factor I subunit 2 [Moesziomyces antarcticus]
MAPTATQPASPGSPSLKQANAVTPKDDGRSRSGSPSLTPLPVTPPEADERASTSKRTLEEEEDLEAARLFPHHAYPPPYKKRVWVPTLHLTQAPQPPQPDPRTVQEMAAQQAATALGYEGRRIKKFMQRRTVDYFGALPRLGLRRALASTTRVDGLHGLVYPSPHAIPNFLLPAGYDNLATSVPSVMVHTSTNKIRCPVNVVKWMPDGRRLLTGSTSGEFTLWNGLTFNFETIMQAHDSAVRAMAWNKAGTYLISADQNGTVKYFQSNLNNLQAFTAHADSARGLAWSPDDSKFASGGDDSLLKVWDFDSAKQIRELTGHGWDVKCLDWHASKGMLISGSKDNLVKVWDPRANPTGTCLATFHNHKNTVQACKFSPDGLRFATASRDMTVKLYDLRMMAEQTTLKGHTKEVCSLDFHPTHHDLLVSGGSEGSMLFWDLTAATNEALSESNFVERSMMGGGGEGMDVSEGRRMDEALLWANHTAHESNVWSLEWHPFGHILCSGSNDHMTRFWQRARPSAVTQSHATSTQDIPVSSFVDNPDDSFIPGLAAANRSFIPTNSASKEDEYAIPGLGLPRAPPPPPPAQQYHAQQPYQPQGFTPGTGANAPLPGTGPQFGWSARGPPPPTQQQPGGTYGAFY